MTKIEVRMSEKWESCNHQWETLVDSIAHNEWCEEVKCVICGCPGEKTIKTGEVDWPTTQTQSHIGAIFVETKLVWAIAMRKPSRNAGNVMIPDEQWPQMGITNIQDIATYLVNTARQDGPNFQMAQIDHMTKLIWVGW